jgi:NADH-quinone oxidoreductase subunit G
MGNFPIGVVGDIGDTRYDYERLGAGPETLKDLADGPRQVHDAVLGRPSGRSSSSARARFRARTGLPCCRWREAGASVNAVARGWNGFGVLHTAASRVGGLDLGLVPGEGGKDVAGMMGAIDVLFLLGADEIDMDRIGSAFTVYIGTPWRRRRAPRRRHPAGRGLHREVGHLRQHRRPRADRATAPASRRARPRRLGDPARPVGRARQDAALSIRCRSCARSSTRVPAFRRRWTRSPGEVAGLSRLAQAGGEAGRAPFASAVKDFYLTNPIARASAVMAECSALARAVSARRRNRAGTMDTSSQGLRRPGALDRLRAS